MTFLVVALCLLTVFLAVAGLVEACWPSEPIDDERPPALRGF